MSSQSADSRVGASSRVARRRVIQWTVLGVVIATLAFGWWIPWFGFSVPIVMITGMVGALFRGRYVCGTLCPRGAFYDRLIAPISRKRPIPRWLRSMGLRWTLFVVLMGFMVYRILLNPLDPLHWGRVFWTMCLVTTAVGIPLGLLIHPRTWCALCPIGTVQNAIGGAKGRLGIDAEACVSCRACERRCPMGLSIVEHRQAGTVPHRDCVRCSECVAACPTAALQWPEPSTCA